jgi:hypothetical protein
MTDLKSCSKTYGVRILQCYSVNKLWERERERKREREREFSNDIDCKMLKKV